MGGGGTVVKNALASIGEGGSYVDLREKKKLWAEVFESGEIAGSQTKNAC